MTDSVIGRNNIKILGKGEQPMLFAHGFGCDQNMWRFVAPAFTDDYKVVLFDYVGCGKSDPASYDASRYSNLDGYAQDLVDIIESLDLTNIVFVGHSVSSIIGMLAAIRRPERFNSLILIGPSPRYVNEPPDYVGGFDRADIEGLLDMMDKNYVGWAGFLAPVIMKNSDHLELSGELEASFCSTDPVTARNFAEATFYADNREDLPKVTTPSLILQCTDDAIAPLEVGEYVHRVLQNSELHIMNATGHCPHMSHPEETIELMREYLATRRVDIKSPAAIL